MAYTCYAEYVRALYTAMQTIQKEYNHFSEFTGMGRPPLPGQPGDWTPWLISVRAPAASQSDRAQRYNQAVADFISYTDQIAQLAARGDSCKTLDDYRKKFRYIIDSQTKNYYCKEQFRLHGQPVEGCRFVFEGPKSIRLAPGDKDAVRLQCNGIKVKNIQVTDPADDLALPPNQRSAHRDAFQLIPANMALNDVYIDRLAGAFLENASIDQCEVTAEKSVLQGIFMSDGLFRNVSVTNNFIRTAGSHFISINGAMTGCKVTNNILQQVPKGKPPRILLDPARLGGNMADDGNLYILSFAPGSEYQYGDVEIHGNQFIGVDANGQSKVLPEQVIDNRDKIPQEPVSTRRDSIFLRNFNFEKFLQQYSTWTLGDFKQNDPAGFRRLEAWLVQRITEYRDNKRLDSYAGAPVLRLPSKEQKKKLLPVLEGALAWLERNEPEVLNRKLAELNSYTTAAGERKSLGALRSFIIKRLASRNGEIELAADLAPVEQARRNAQLKWFLAEPLEVDRPHAAVLPQNFSTLAIRAQPLSATVGETITFRVNEADYFQPGDELGYYWLVDNQMALEPEFTLNTRLMNPGDHHIRLTVHKRNGQPLFGSARFSLAAADEPQAPYVRPLRAYGELKEAIRVSHSKLQAGEHLSVRLDESFVNQQAQQARLVYAWRHDGSSTVLHGPLYDIETDTLDAGELVIWVTLHLEDRATGGHTQLSGVAVVAVADALIV